MDEGGLLAQARVFQDKRDALAAATGESFNLFALLNRERDEEVQGFAPKSATFGLPVTGTASGEPDQAESV